MYENYPRPAHGWTCFFCGDTFHSVGQARAHFGDTLASEPGCKVRVPPNETGLLIALRNSEAEIERLRRESEQSDQEAGCYQQMCKDLERLTGSRSVFMAFDTWEGRVLTAEATLQWISRTHPDLVAQAREYVCNHGIEAVSHG